MHTEFHVPPAVQKIRRSRIHVCRRSSLILWMKQHANRRQRRYMRQAMDRMRHDPELYYGEGLRGLPQPLTMWDID